WHAADKVVVAEQVQEATVDNRAEFGAECIGSDHLPELVLTERLQIFGERHGTHVEVLDSSYRHRQALLRQCELHERACRYDGNVTMLFVEIAQCRDRS